MTTAEIRPVAPSSPDPNFPSMKLAVVTGAGNGIAGALAEKGCRLAICDVDEPAVTPNQ